MENVEKSQVSGKIAFAPRLLIVAIIYFLKGLNNGLHVYI